MIHSNPLQLSHVQHFQQESVCPPAFEKVPKFLPQLPTARVSVGTIDGDKNISICARSLFITCDDDDLILDRYQASGFTGKALDGLCTLKCQELIPLWRERDSCIANEDVPGGVHREERYNVLETKRADVDVGC